MLHHQIGKRFRGSEQAQRARWADVEGAAGRRRDPVARAECSVGTFFPGISDVSEMSGDTKVRLQLARCGDKFFDILKRCVAAETFNRGSMRF